jgi:hypothetical protein
MLIFPRLSICLAAIMYISASSRTVSENATSKLPPNSAQIVSCSYFSRPHINAAVIASDHRKKKKQKGGKDEVVPANTR